MDSDVLAEAAGRMMSGTFTLDDFLTQMDQVRKMGSLGGHHEDDAGRHEGDALARRATSTRAS